MVSSGNDELDRREAQREAELADKPWLASDAPAPTIDEAVAYYEQLSGISTQHRAWYRGFQGLKMAVINLVGSMLFESGDSNDTRFAMMGYSVHWLTQRMLAEFDIHEEIEPGPVTPSPERMATITPA